MINITRTTHDGLPPRIQTQLSVIAGFERPTGPCVTAVGNIEVRAYQSAIAHRISRMKYDSPPQRHTRLDTASREQLTAISEALRGRVDSTGRTRFPRKWSHSRPRYNECLDGVQKLPSTLGFKRTQFDTTLPRRGEHIKRIDPATCQQPLHEVKTTRAQ